MAVQAKTSQVQIRVTPRQKAALKRRASAAGLDVSTFVLSRALPGLADQFGELIRGVGDESRSRFALAELNTFLTEAAPAEFADATTHAELRRLSPYLQNYVAAMVEQAAHLKHVAPPAWVRDVEPLDAPYFAASLKSLRPHLIAASPVAFKRRNLFVDASIGDRV
ncbi:MAG: hypothetical protein P3B98_12230 [Gemmatimonadota bacterium]|nr:hypothetical protein [Gemmatimonadota bacterium]